MFVVFEGIDGSGKTAVSNRVARRLRAAGTAVEHVREEGEFASPLVRRLREFGKDPRNLALEPLPEVLLYLAREAQILAELTRPALARGGLVFADRYLYSYEVLGHHGRGLPREPVRALLDAVAGGLWPDLVVLLDVDPHLARARRRVSKIDARAAGKPPGTGSRKGLAGAGAQRRIREGYLELAAQDPDRWLVLENGAPEVGLDELVDRAVAAIEARRAGRAIERRARPAAPAPVTAPVTPPAADRGAPPSIERAVERAVERFFDEVAARAGREPAVAAYLLAGVGHPAAQPWRERLAGEAPHVVAHGLRGLADEGSWRLREELRDRSPYHVARSLAGPAVVGDRADDMRRSLADAEPQAVLATLAGDAAPAAWALRTGLADRDLAAVVASLERLDEARAWELRDRYLRQRGGEAALAEPAAAAPLASSLRGLGGPDAWRLRRSCFDAAPVAVLGSLADVADDESFAWRARWLERAPRVVLRSLVRLDDPRAWAMRRRMAPLCKESLDSMAGMDAPEAWTLREEAVTRWPSTAVKSLGPLLAGERGAALAAAALAAAPDDLSLLKHLAALSHDGASSWEEAD